MLHPGNKIATSTVSILVFFLAVSPKVNDQISHEQNLENSLKMENAKPVDAMAFTGATDGNERGDHSCYVSVKGGGGGGGTEEKCSSW
jgi:hypothetical protein